MSPTDKEMHDGSVAFLVGRIEKHRACDPNVCQLAAYLNAYDEVYVPMPADERRPPDGDTVKR